MLLPPDDETICLGYARGAAHPRDADDAALVDGPLDFFENLDDGIALPNLRELVPCDLQRFQDAVRLFLGDEAMFWYELMLQYVKPQGGASLGNRPFSTWHATRVSRTGPRGLSGTRAVRRARSNPGPPGFFPHSVWGRG